MADDRKKVSTEQLSLLLMAIEDDPSLINGRTANTKLKNKYTDKWTQLAEKLNSVENGVFKDIHKWQQAWRDWKSNTKKKAYKIWKEKSEKENSAQELNALELRVLNLIDSETDLNYTGIDISNIIEIDPLSSDDDEVNASPSESKRPSAVYSPEMLTVYNSDGATNGNSVRVQNSKRFLSEEQDEVNVKRQCMQLNSDSMENTPTSTTEILDRLTTLEQNSERRYNTLLEVAVKALERQAAASVRQAEAAELQAKTLERLLKFLEGRYSGE